MENKDSQYKEVVKKLINLVVLLLVIIVILGILLIRSYRSGNAVSTIPSQIKEIQIKSDSILSWWIAPDTSEIKNEANASQIRYGRELIQHTALYFGPSGKIKPLSNGMNCQNCHLDAGTKPFGNNYGGVASTYPKFKARSGSIETVFKRIGDCFERSLNGSAPDSHSVEMKAMKSYILWLGKKVEKGEKPTGSGLSDLPYLNRAADTLNGKSLYALKCSSCHTKSGEGKFLANAPAEYQYPPLWGPHSYNIGAGLHRLSRLATYIKYNMPLGATHNNPQLSDEEAWDIAAFVNSQPRPKKDLSKDWPNPETKPADHPFGPYTDTFSETQHKYGPFEPIVAAHKKK